MPPTEGDREELTGTDSGERHAAAIYSPVGSVGMNGPDPERRLRLTDEIITSIGLIFRRISTF
jgi:hypothetical protein